MASPLPNRARKPNGDSNAKPYPSGMGDPLTERGLPPTTARAVGGKAKMTNRDLGFEPSSLPSTSHCVDSGLTLENLELQAFTIHTALRYIVVALGSHRQRCCQLDEAAPPREGEAVWWVRSRRIASSKRLFSSASR